MEQIYDYTIKLIRYVLNGDVPELSDDIDFERLFAFGKSHGVENMLYVGLRDLNIAVPEDTMKKFKKAHEMAIMLEAKQAFELEDIGEKFEKAGIDYVPLKGSIVKYLYPMPDYRKSGDIDILIHPEDKEKIDNLMQSLGYKRNAGYDSHKVHFSYAKPTFINVEMHKRLTAQEARANRFCERVWNYCELQKGSKHLYHLTNEYHYMFLMAHLCRHLYLGGAGIRLIADIYIMRRNVQLDYSLIEEYIKKANLTDIHNMVLGVVDKWFADAEKCSDDIKALEHMVFTSGSFGTKEMRDVIISSNTFADRCVKYVQRMFPPVRILKRRYGFLEKMPWMLPVMWIYRFFDIGFREKDTISEKTQEIFGSHECVGDLKNIVKAIRDY